MNNKTVNAENKRLMALFENVDPNKVDFCREHVRQLAWYNVQIRELQKNLDKDGLTVEFQNGRNQHGLQSNPDLRALIDLQKLTNAMIRTLMPLVPECEKSSKLADFFNLDNVDSEEYAEREQQEEERQKRIQAEINKACEIQRKQREQNNNQEQEIQ